MRANFNIVIVDDLFLDEDDRKVIDSYISYLRNIIENKGFRANFHEFTSPTIALQQMNVLERKRIDLYISDNNLGDGESEGIDFYLQLKKEFICDFILYTQSVVGGIIEKLKIDLDTYKDPNLFSRFSFISRQTDNIWRSKSQDIINHIISKREEFNNLRGLFAQTTTKIHTHLAMKALPAGVEKKFSSTIEEAFRKRLFNAACREQLHQIRLIRNALMHKDEEFCQTQKKYFIEYNTPVIRGNMVNENGPVVNLYEDGNFGALRQKLKSLENSILAI